MASYIASRLATSLFLLAILLLPPVVAPARAEAEKPTTPELAAVSAIAIDADTGEVIFDKDSAAQLPMASTTKIMTAILAIERTRLDDMVTIKSEDLVGEAAMGLREGERVSMENLLYGMLLNSGNDAAMAIARHIGESLTEPVGASPVTRFVALMNERAKQLGCTGTNFVNPHGLDDPNHYSTAADLATMAREFQKHDFLNRVAATEYYEAAGHPLSNLNKLLTQYEGADGLKTGLTDNAGLCLVASAKRSGISIITVVLNSPAWYDDTIMLLDQSFAYVSSLPPSARAPKSEPAQNQQVLIAQPESALAPTGEVELTSNWHPSALLDDWQTLALALMVGVVVISLIRLFVTFTTSHVSPDERMARRIAAESASQARTLEMRYVTPHQRTSLRRRTRSPKRFSLSGLRPKRTIPKQVQARAQVQSPNVEQVQEARRVASALDDQAAAIISFTDGGDEDGATLAILRMIRNGEATPEQLMWAIEDRSPTAIACLVRALTIYGDKEHSRSVLTHGAARYPDDARLKILKRLMD